LKRYQRMKRMINGTDEDVKLITNIVNECDIEESLLYILALIPQKYEEKKTFCTPLSGGVNLFNYLSSKAIGTHYTLDTLVGIWQVHCEKRGISHAKGQKFLAQEYIAPPRRREGKGILNPKKKRV